MTSNLVLVVFLIPFMELKLDHCFSLVHLLISLALGRPPWATHPHLFLNRCHLHLWTDISIPYFIFLGTSIHLSKCLK